MPTPIPALQANDLISKDGTVRPAYKIAHHIGTGGVGRVYLAQVIDSGEWVVLKFPNRWDCAFDVFQESRYLVNMSWNHVAKIRAVDFGRIPRCDFEVPYLVMDCYYSSLAVHLKEVGSVDAQTALTWTKQIALGLMASKLLHRDLKPENVLLDEKKIAWVSDFGLAIPSNPYTRQNSGIECNGLMGTAIYMSPEQICEAQHIDHRSDIYAIGLLLFELITGLPAHPRKTVRQSLDDYYDQLLDYRVKFQDVKIPAVARIVQLCTEKQRAKRYADYWYLMEDLDAALRAVSAA